MRASRRVLAALAGTGLLVIAALSQPMSVAAFPLNGCRMTLTSLNADGNEIDSAVGGSVDATQDDPLLVSWGGSVRWTRDGDALPAGNGSWHVDVFGVPTMLRGSDGPTESDVLDVSDSMPFRFTGLFFVAGQLDGPGVACSGSGWLRLMGEPLSTLPFTLALGVLLIGLVLLAVAARGRWSAAVPGGLLVGAGAAILMVIYATLPLGEATPAAALAIGLVTGGAVGWYGSRQQARSRPRSGAPAS